MYSPTHNFPVPSILISKLQVIQAPRGTDRVSTPGTMHMQGGHGGFTQIPYILPYTPTKITVQYRTFSEQKYRTYRTFSFTCTVHTQKNLIGFKKNCALGKPQK